MKQWMLCALCLLVLASCGGNASVNGNAAGNVNAGAEAQPAAIDFSNPEAVFAAYSRATDLGDVEAMDRLLLPSQRGMTTGATGVSEANRGYTIVRRDDRSASEVLLLIKFKAHPETLPQVLVLQDGKWYLDMEKTLDAMLESVGD